MNLFIHNLSLEDAPLVEAALNLGHHVFASSASDEPGEFENLCTHYKNVELLKIPTAFEEKKTPREGRQQSNRKIRKFCQENKIKVQLRTARYTKTQNVNLEITVHWPWLEKFFPVYGLHWNKALYLPKLTSHGINTPTLHQIVFDQDEPRIITDMSLFPIICKPAYCSGGMGVMIVHSQLDIDRLFSYEKNSERFSDLNLYHRNRTAKGVRNYLYNSGHFGGPYIIQQYVPGRVLSVSGALVKNKIHDFFAYEIHSTQNEYCAEQAFSWPLSSGLDEQLLQFTQKIISVLGYPSGPFMADFVLSNSGELFVIDAAPRTSLTAVKISGWAKQNQDHAHALVAAHWDELYPVQKDLQKQNPVYWQRFPFPKGKIKSITYPAFCDSNILFVETPLQNGQKINELRTDRQMVERGSLAVTGKNLTECQDEWNKHFEEIQWILE